jgi:hypothetical protein
MRHSFCTPLPISLLPRGVRASPTQRCLVARLRRVTRRYVRDPRTLPSAVALPAITRRANKARHLAALADESPQRIDHNLDGVPMVMRALIRSGCTTFEPEDRKLALRGPHFFTPHETIESSRGRSDKTATDKEGKRGDA